MNLTKMLDIAIKNYEHQSNMIINGYKTKSGFYENYMTNNEWQIFQDGMKINHPDAYLSFHEGNGKEMIEKNTGKYVFPPKMASYGSSSRMIYNLAKDVNGFSFEKKLPTTIGGTANLDGYFEKEKEYVFIEAKCREPYSGNNNTIHPIYQELYKYISQSTKTPLHCHIGSISQKQMHVRFVYNGTEIKYFDIKQMLCHLLGIATAVINGCFTDKNIKFLYLLYDPTILQFSDDETHKQINEIYFQTCRECSLIDFEALYLLVYEYLITKIGQVKSVELSPNDFTFTLCSNNNFINELSNDA